MTPAGPVVLLSGGTGGAKLARGMLEVVGGERLVVIANTGDDIEIYGAHVSPDPDLVAFWLADLIDDRGWGLAGDTFAVMDGLRALGREIWFNLGDRDLAIGLERLRRLTEGERLTEAHAAICAALKVPGRVLPMCDEPVRTRVLAAGRWWGLQDFLIRAPRGTAVDDVDYRGAQAARPTPEIQAAVRDAEAIVIGPSNPVISIGPILALPGMREAITAAPAPVVAVSPIVGGQIIKGPTGEFLAWTGHPQSASGIAALYAGLIDGIVADEPVDVRAAPASAPPAAPPSAPPRALQTDVFMDSAPARRRVAEQTLGFARALRADRLAR